MAEGEGEGTTTTTSVEALESLERIIEKKKEQLKIDQQEAALLNDASEQLRLQSQLNEEILKGLANQLEKKGALNNLSDEVKTQLQDQLGLEKEALDTLLKQEGAQEQILKSLAKRRAIEKDIQNTVKESDNFVGGIASKLGIASSLSETTAGNIIKLSDGLESSGKGAEILSASIARSFNLLNVSLAVLSKMYESTLLVALAADQAASNFQRATGFAGEIQMDLAEIARAGVASGVTLEDAGKAMGSLANNFSAFNPTASETNIELSNTVTLLEKTGVSADASAKTMDFFNKVLGESPKAAAKLTEQLALAGTGIGITTSKMLSDFESVNGYIVGFGDRTTEVFLELQAQAKATGVSISSLVGIAKKFDTFDDAAKVAGSLNAALGTQIGQLDMINASAEQRIALLAQEIDFASGGFENLDRYTQMYVAQTIGAKDVAEAQRILNLQRDPAALAEYNTKMQEQQARQQDLNELTEQFVPVIEQFKIAVLGLGLAFEPVIEVLGFAFEVFGKIVGVISKLLINVPFLAEAFGTLFAALVSLTVFNKITGLMSAFSTAAGIQTTANTTLAASQTVQAAAQTEQAIVQQVTAPIINKSSQTMSAGFIKLAPALAIASGAALAISGAMYGLAAAFEMAVPPFILLFETLVANMDTLPELALGLYLAGPAFAAFGAGVASGAVSLALATPFLLIANYALSGMVETVTLLGAGFSAMGTGILDASSGISALVAGLQQISDLTGEEGFIAVSSDGGKTSVVSAKGGIIKNFTSDSITVDVKIPEIKMPEVNVKVYIGDTELRDIIRKTVGIKT